MLPLWQLEATVRQELDSPSEVCALCNKPNPNMSIQASSLVPEYPPRALVLTPYLTPTYVDMSTKESHSSTRTYVGGQTKERGELLCYCLWNRKHIVHRIEDGTAPASPERIHSNGGLCRTYFHYRVSRGRQQDEEEEPTDPVVGSAECLMYY